MDTRQTHDQSTIGEKWHEEAENEPFWLSFATFGLAIFAALSIAFAGAGTAEAADLSSGTIQVQAQAKKPTKTTYVVKIAKLRTAYSLEYSKTEKKTVEKLIVKAADASKTSTARKAYNKAVKVSKRAKALHSEKAKTVRTDKGLYTKWKGYFTPAQAKSAKALISYMEKSRTSEKLRGYAAAFTPYISRAKLCQHVDARSWSNAKVEVVTEWAPRVNEYLKGSPMAGTGYLIVKAAYDTDMDPRLYAAISEVESGRGTSPYGSQFNVCGWIWNPPAMYGWEDAAVKWHGYFKQYWGGERYPITSMHGYGGYGPSYVNAEMAKI